MDVHSYLGPGLLEVVYKDALEIEFKENNIQFEREKEFSNEHNEQVLNYVKLAKSEVVLLVNFQQYRYNITDLYYKIRENPLIRGKIN